ncbi:MAG TPA: competence/damage-inducible protein A [Acidimicrobiia bacterium]
MIVEVVAVGTELLLGQIVNTNLAFIGAALAEVGLDSHFQTVVGDNQARIATAISVALERADAVVVTGGIGPTQDDLTREGIASALGRELVRSEDYVVELRERWERLGREMPESNLRQADAPGGAEMIPNPKGTAPALAIEQAGKWVFVVPGVPEEMHLLMETEVVPRLLALAGRREVIVNRVLRSWGRSESQVAEMLDDLYSGSINPSLAYLASGGELKLRMTAKAADVTAARELIEPMEAEVRRRLGESVFGADEETIEQILGSLLSRRRWMLATAESATGGLVAARLTSVPGSSKWFRGSVVAYAPDLKERLLSVDLANPLVSPETAVGMAEGVRRALGTEVGIGVTGSAGPDPLEAPPGTMVIGVATPEGSKARTLRLPGDRERVRVYATTGALHLARLAITGKWWSE